MLRRAAVLVTLAFGGLVAMAVPAYGGNWTDSESTTGAAASCTMRSWTAQIHDQNADISCDISDTLGDSHSVYVEWWQDGYAKKRLTNHDGAGHTTHSYDSRYNSDGSFETLYWRVCRDVQLGHDNCSRTISHATATPQPGRTDATSASATPTSPVASIGKLFTHGHGASDKLNCTGTVLDTPKRDIVLTAKHCTAGIGKWAFEHFSPGYDMSASNTEPYGAWKVKGAYDGPGDLEVLVMEAKDGKNIQDVVGGQPHKINVNISGHVSITGYPSSGKGRPYRCEAAAAVHVWKGHPNEWQTDCGKNFDDGVSGSAYIVDGNVVAALGGDHEGSAGPDGEFSLGDPLTSDFESFLQDVLKHHA